MKSFIQHQHLPDDIDTLIESVQRTASATVVVAYMKRQTTKIKQEKNLSKKIDLLANLVNASAAATFAFTQFKPTDKR